MSRSTWSWSPASARTSSSSPPTSRDSRALMMLSCMSGCELPSAVRLLPRTFQVSPTTPSLVDSSASSRTSRPSISGRRTISSSVPLVQRGSADLVEPGLQRRVCRDGRGRRRGRQHRSWFESARRASTGGTIPPLCPESRPQRSAWSAHRSMRTKPFGRVGVVVRPRRHAVDRGDLDAPQRVRRRVLDVVEDRQAPRRPASARARRARRDHVIDAGATEHGDRPTVAGVVQPSGDLGRTVSSSERGEDRPAQPIPASACRRRTDGSAAPPPTHPARRASRSAISRFVATIR